MLQPGLLNPNLMHKIGVLQVAGNETGITAFQMDIKVCYSSILSQFLTDLAIIVSFAIICLFDTLQKSL